MTNIELLKKINKHLEFLMDCTIEPSDVRSSTKQLMDDIKSTICNSKSNGDRIRQMSDEELAEMFTRIGERCRKRSHCQNCPIVSGCNYDGMIKPFEIWLKEEAKDDDER